MIEPYDHGEHVARLNKWLSMHGLRVPDRRLFSDCGFIVDKVAIGFLFKTNSKQAYIDHVAADPNASSDIRSAALTKLFFYLEELARKDGFLMVTALAQLPSMKRRFEAHGFSAYGDFSLYYKVIGG